MQILVSRFRGRAPFSCICLTRRKTHLGFLSRRAGGVNFNLGKLVSPRRLFQDADCILIVNE